MAVLASTFVLTNVLPSHVLNICRLYPAGGAGQLARIVESSPFKCRGEVGLGVTSATCACEPRSLDFCAPLNVIKIAAKRKVRRRSPPYLKAELDFEP